MPEKINTVWSWYYFTENQDHVVQTIVEKAMFDMGYDVIDLATVTLFQEPGTIEQVLDPRTAVQLAQQLGAEYVIVGHATAMQATDAQPRPGGRLDRIRSEATAVARVIRVSDGKVVAIEEAQSTGSAQTRQNLADGALREAAQRLSAKLAADLNLINLP